MPSNRCPLTAVPLTPELTGMLPSQKLRVGNVAGSGRARPSCGDASCALVVTPPSAAQPTLRSLPRNVLHTIFSALPVCSVGLAASTNSHLRSAAREWVQRNDGAALGETDRRELKCAFEEWESIGLSAVASVQKEWSGKSAEQQTKMMADFCEQRERGLQRIARRAGQDDGTIRDDLGCHLVPVAAGGEADALTWFGAYEVLQGALSGSVIKAEDELEGVTTVTVLGRSEYFGVFRVLCDLQELPKCWQDRIDFDTDDDQSAHDSDDSDDSDDADDSDAD
jgi:hypothetical protein